MNVTEQKRLSKVVVDDDGFHYTVGTNLQYSQQGFHWQFEVDDEMMVETTIGKIVCGYIDGAEVARGVVTDIGYSADGERFRCYVEPPFEP